VSEGSVAPGPRSREGLAWLARVGAAPIEPLALVMRWSQRAAYDHVARMAAAGWVRRVRLDFGDGSLLVITRAGVRRVLEEHDVPEDVEADDELRDVSPTMRAHVVASAWTAAWLDVYGCPWIGPRAVGRDAGWSGRVAYPDAAGTREVSHAPDLGVITTDGKRLAVEVELQRKSAARLRGILAMYAARGAGGDLDGVMYVAGNARVRGALHDVAAGRPLRGGEAERAAVIAEAPAGPLRVIALEDVIAQTRARGNELHRERRAAEAAA